MIGESSQPFNRLMALVPIKERSDIKLKRFLLFRMKIDGEEATRDYLLKGIDHAKKSAFGGSLYEYLKDCGESLSGGAPKNLLPDESG